MVTNHICSNERQFLELKGDGTEIVKITFDYDRLNHQLNGWYLLLGNKEQNNFIKQAQGNIPLIDRISCETKYLQFDRNIGIHPDGFHYDFSPIGIKNPEYEGLKAKLEAVDAWKSI